MVNKFDEDWQFENNRAYVYARIQDTPTLTSLFNRFGIVSVLAQSVQQGVFQYTTVMNSDQYNILANVIDGEQVPAIISRGRLDTFNIITGNAQQNIFTLTFPITLG